MEDSNRNLESMTQVGLLFKIMLATILAAFLLVTLCLILYQFMKRYCWRSEDQLPSPAGGSRRRRLGFARRETVLRQDQLRSLPSLILEPQGVKEEEYECAVCLSTLRGGERVRFLPKCNHGFHANCIDTWFQHYYPTCPICRLHVLDDDPTLKQNIQSNVLYWGSQTWVNFRVSRSVPPPSSTSGEASPPPQRTASPEPSSTSGSIEETVIHVSCFSESALPEEQHTTPPMMNRLFSFSRLLNRSDGERTCYQS